MSVRQDGENFSQASWRAMRKVAAGKTISYADLAKRAGSPEAVRAAGSACATELLRVVASWAIMRTVLRPKSGYFATKTLLSKSARIEADFVINIHMSHKANECWSKGAD